MTERLVLFDIDGTILRSGGIGFRAMARAAVEVFGCELPWDRVDPAGSLDPVILEEALGHAGVEATPTQRVEFKERYAEHFPRELEQRPERLRVLPGVVDLISSLAAGGEHVLGLLTGNYEPTARHKVEAAGIPWSHFRVGAFGDEAPARPEVLPIAVARYEKLYGVPIARERVFIVGDTPKDIECARAGGCRAFCVATGKFTVDELRAAGADAVASDLSDPAPLLEFLRATG